MLLTGFFFWHMVSQEVKSMKQKPSITWNKNWLKDMLMDLSLSIPQFASLISKPRPTVDRWLNGSKPNADTLCMLMDKFNLSPNYFFERSK